MKGKIDLHAIISHLILATEPNITDDQITNRNVFVLTKKNISNNALQLVDFWIRNWPFFFENV